MSSQHQIKPPFSAPEYHSIFRRCADSLLQGGVGIFPTAALYGLAADAFNPDAIQKIYSIKHRSADNPLLLLVPPSYPLSNLVTSVPVAAQKLMNAIWPGGLTIVMDASPDLPSELTAGTGKIGIRRPLHPAAAMLCEFVGRPITGTSANLAGTPGCSHTGQIPDAIRSVVQFEIDAGDLPGEKSSTVVDVTTTPVTILREGAVSAEQIAEITSRQA